MGKSETLPPGTPRVLRASLPTLKNLLPESPPAPARACYRNGQGKGIEDEEEKTLPAPRSALPQ